MSRTEDEPAPETWSEVSHGLVRRFRVAAAVGGSAVWNAKGSAACAELIEAMVTALDETTGTIIPELRAENARLERENARLRTCVRNVDREVGMSTDDVPGRNGPDEA